jgi:hypothetical protein
MLFNLSLKIIPLKTYLHIPIAMSVKSFFKSHSPVMFGQFNTQNDSWDVKEQTEANREPVAIL